MGSQKDILEKNISNETKNINEDTEIIFNEKNHLQSRLVINVIRWKSDKQNTESEPWFTFNKTLVRLNRLSQWFGSKQESVEDEIGVNMFEKNEKEIDSLARIKKILFTMST